MMKSRVGMSSKPLGLAISLGVFTASLSGCAVVETFTSPDPIGNGVRGKVWTTQEYLEPNPNNVAYDAATLSTFRRFSVAASGSQAFLAASIYESASGKFQGYARLFQAGIGWSSPGPGFSMVANGSASLSYASIAAGPGGSWLSVFQDGSVSGIAQATYTAANNGVWQPAHVSDPLTPADPGNGGPAFAATTDQSFGSPVDIAFDSLGRAYVATAVAGTNQLVLKRWGQAGGIDQQNAGATSAAGLVPGPLVAARYDGTQWVCAYSQHLTTATIVQQCYDTTNAVAWGSSGPALQTAIVTTPGLKGFSTASSNDGTIVLANYEMVSGTAHVVVRAVVSGVIQPGTTVVSAGMPGTYAASAGLFSAPQIVHLGGGSFIVAWTAVDGGANSALFSALYTPAAGWAAPAMIGSAQAFPAAFGAIHLFTNEDGNAGVAASFSADITLASTTLATARYQSAQGWLPTQFFGNGCSTGTPATVAFCSQRPQGAITSNGDTVVVFPDQDPSGHFRLGGVEFR